MPVGFAARGPLALPAEGGDYEGPGDIVTTGWIAWWGLRAFSAATRGQRCCRIVQVVDLGETDIYTDPVTGVVDVAAILAFAALGTGGVARAKIMYDQCGRSVDVSHAAGINFQYNSIGALPLIDENSFGLGGVVGANFPQPYTFVGVAKHIGAASSQGAIVSGVGGTAQIGFAHSGSPDIAFLYGGSLFTRPAVDNTPHALIGVFNGASSILSVDGVESSPTAGGSVNITSTDDLDFCDLAGYTFEGGAVSGTISAQRAALAANMKTYYGIP